MPIHEPYNGVWATRDNKLLGIVLADSKKNEQSELFSFFVKPDERNKGIGSQLLSLLEAALIKQGTKRIQLRYRNDWGSKLYLEKLLASNNWENPSLLRIIAEIDIKMHIVVPWPHIKLASDYSLFGWKELSKEDRTEIDNMIQKRKIPNEFIPYHNENKIFLPVSVGLRYKNQIIGWNIVYSLRPDTIEYNNLFIREEYRKLGYAITLLHKSSTEQYNLNIPKMTWVVNSNNTAVMKIAMKIAGKHVSKMVEVKTSSKYLK